MAATCDRNMFCPEYVKANPFIEVEGLTKVFKYLIQNIIVAEINMGIGQGVAMDSLKFHPGLPCPTLLPPAGGPPPERPYDCFRGCPPAGWAACGCLLPSGHPTLYAYEQKVT